MSRVLQSSFRTVVLFALFAWSSLDHAGASDWEHLENCVLVPSSLNDGDSFVVRTGAGQEFVIRLYFVDCPESSNLFPDRVREQANYFGTTVRRTLELGAASAEFIAATLKEREFSVYTTREDGWGQAKRYLGIVVVGNKTLCEILVENGLARIKGFTPETAWPGGVRSSTHKNRLEVAEKEARRLQVGGWGDKKQSVRGVANPPSATTPLTVHEGLINLNEATQKELMKLPYIGEVLAKRIVDGKPWYEVEDLRLINGIGDLKMMTLKPLVTVVSREAPKLSADYYRTNAEQYLNRTVTVAILNVKEVTWPAPDGFSVVQAFTGSEEKFGGAIPLFFPEDDHQKLLAFYAEKSIGETTATFFNYQGKPVLVKPREKSETDY